MTAYRKFRIATAALLLAVLAVLQGATADSDAALWQNYQVAFGPRLNASFASTSTLDECHTVEQTQPLDFTTSPPQIGCSNYENGDTIGKLIIIFIISVNQWMIIYIYNYLSVYIIFLSYFIIFLFIFTHF